MNGMNYDVRPVGPANRKKKHYSVTPTAEPNGNRAERDYNAPRERPLPRNKRSHSAGPKPRVERPAAFSHDDLIATFKGKKIQFLVMGVGTVTEAMLVDADKFALVVQFKTGAPQIVLFKHALAWVKGADE